MNPACEVPLWGRRSFRSESLPSRETRNGHRGGSRRPDPRSPQGSAWPVPGCWCRRLRASVGELSAGCSHVGSDFFLAEAGGALPYPSPDLVETTQYGIVRILQQALELVVRHEDGLWLLIASHDVRDVVFGDLVEDDTETLPQLCDGNCLLHWPLQRSRVRPAQIRLYTSPSGQQIQDLRYHPTRCRAGLLRPFRPQRWGAFLSQGIGLRPQPWAGVSRPVGPAG